MNFKIIFLFTILLGLASAQTSIPFTPLNELRIKFQSVVTDLKLNIFANVFNALKCAPNVTTTFLPKENSYLSYYTVDWTLNGANVYTNRVEVGQYLYSGQAFKFVERVATFNCQYGGHPELKYQPGRYTFTYTLYDNFKRMEVIGKVTYSDQLACTAMTSAGCWAYTKCDPSASDCKNTFRLTSEE